MHKTFKCGPSRLLMILLVLTLVSGAVKAQFALGLEAAPALETITLREATITRGYNLIVVPQAALRLRYESSKHVGLRLSAGWMPKGAKVWFEADRINGYPEGSSPLQARYLAGKLGLELKAPFSDVFAALGSLDFVYGRLVQARRVLPDGDAIPFDDFFSKGFFGLDFAVELQYRLLSGIEFRFAPTLEIQLNQAYKSNFFQPEFRGFAPKIAVYFPIDKF
jgi:hypothetical protein